MKLLALSIAVTCACFLLTEGSIWNEKPREFENGKIYQYFYQAQVMTGLPGVSTQYTGFVLKTNVFMVEMDRKDFRIKATLKDITFKKFNGRMNETVAKEFIDERVLEDLNEDNVEEVILKELKKPFYFTWKLGKIPTLQVRSDDAFWSVNMKKGLLASLNVNLKPYRHSVPTKYEIGETRGDFYEGKYENELEGRCRSTYQWKELPMESKFYEKSQENIGLIVRKTRIPNQCLDQSEIAHASILCFNCQGERRNVTDDLVQTQTETVMNVTFWRNENFFVWDSMTSSRYTFAPVSARIGSVSSFVKQLVTFVKVSDDDITEYQSEMKSEDMHKEETLKMRMPFKEFDFEDKKVNENLIQPTKESLEKIFKALTDTKSNFITDLPILTNDVILRLRKMPFESLKTILEFVQEKKTKKFTDFFMDLLPTVATKDSLKLILKEAILKVDDDNQKDWKYARLVRSYSTNNNIFDDETIQLLMQTASNYVLRKDVRRRECLKAILFALGSIVRTRIEHVEKYENSEIIEKVTDYLLKVLKIKITNLNRNELLIVVIKSMANMRTVRAKDFLLKQFVNDKNSQHVRLHAIYAMKTLARIHRQDIQRIVFPVLSDSNVDAEVRMAAYLVMMATQPKFDKLHHLVRVMEKETSRQVMNFVFSHLQTLSQSTVECDRPMRKLARKLLEQLTYRETTRNAGFQYSTSYSVPLHETSKTSFDMKNKVFWNPDQVLPVGFQSKLEMNFESKKRIEAVEFSVRMNGLQELFTKLFGPNGRYYNTAKLQDILREYDNTVVATDHNVAFYLKLFGEEVGYWALNEDMKNELLSGFIPVSKDLKDVLNGKRVLPVSFRRVTQNDVLLRIPTTMGVPFTTNLTSFIYYDVQATIQMKRGLFDEEKTHAEMKFNTEVITQHRLAVGIDLSVLKAFTFVKVDANLPRTENMILHIVADKKKDIGLRFNFEHDTDLMKLFRFRSTVRTVIEELKIDSEYKTIGMFDVDEKPLINRFITKDEAKEDLKKKSLHLILNSFNRILNIELQIPFNSLPSILERGHHFLLAGDFDFSVSFSQMSRYSRSRSIELRIIGGKTDKSFEKFIIQVLSKKVFDAEESVRSEWTSIENNDKVNPKHRVRIFDEDLKINEEYDLKSKDVIGEIRVLLSKKKLFTIVKVAKTTFITIETTLIRPRNIIFDQTQPMKMLNREDNRVVVDSVFYLSNRRKFMKSTFLINMDKETYNFHQHVVKNIEEFISHHPHPKQCVSDMARGFKNSLACFEAWRYFNALNRIEMIFEIFNPVSQHVHKIHRRFNRKYITKRSCIHSMKTSNVVHIMNNCKDENEENDTSNSPVFKIRFDYVWSPYSARILTKFITLAPMLKFYESLHVPRLAFNRFHTTESFLPSMLKSLTLNKYPATCRLRRDVTTNFGQSETFDGVMMDLSYIVPTLTMRKELEKGSAIILSQDQNKTFQASAIELPNKRIIQLRLRKDLHKIKLIQIEQQKRQDKTVKVLIDGKQIALPYVLKDEKTQRVIFSVKNFRNTVYGVEEIIVVESQLAGIKMTTDLLTLFELEVSPFYHSKLRGICGNFDGEAKYDLTTPDCRKYYYHPSDVYQSCDYIFNNLNNSENLLEWIPWVDIEPCEKTGIFWRKVQPTKVCTRSIN